MYCNDIMAEDGSEKYVDDSIELYKTAINDINIKLQNPKLTFEERHKLQKDKQENLVKLQSFKSMKIKSEEES